MYLTLTPLVHERINTTSLLVYADYFSVGVIYSLLSVTREIVKNATLFPTNTMNYVTGLNHYLNHYL